MANFRRRKPRLRTCNHPQHFLNDPAWWTRLCKIRPQRRKVRRAEKQILQGFDQDSMVWPVDNKPNPYYW
jgi:hypothetical protein